VVNMLILNEIFGSQKSLSLKCCAMRYAKSAFHVKYSIFVEECASVDFPELTCMMLGLLFVSKEDVCKREFIFLTRKQLDKYGFSIRPIFPL
jgi:hypothetical protein